MARRDYLSCLPPDWQSDLDGIEIEPVERSLSGARLFRLRNGAADELFLKICKAPQLPEFRAEIERTKWLAARGVRVPRFVRIFDDGGVGAGLMTALSGRHPQDVRLPTADVIRILAEGLLALHSLPVLECPFDESISMRLKRAREMIERGLAEPDDFDERNRNVTPEQLNSRLSRTIPRHEGLSVVHGDATFDNLLIDDDGKVGFIDCGHAGRGDRYLDLATVIMDIEGYWGADWIARFALSYDGGALDADKLDFFSDLYELF